jgi:hypothetical protein
MRGGAVLGLALLGVAAVGVVLAVGSDDQGGVPGGLDRELLMRVVRRTAKHEGGGKYDAINPNNEAKVDPPGPGVSAFLIQWTQGSGNLGTVLTAMRARDQLTFDAVVGGPTVAAELLRVTRAGSLAPVNGAVLWAPVWVGKFIALGRHPPFQQVQVEIAATGAHMRAAIEVAKVLHITSEKGLALAFDRCVQQGEYGMPKLARRLAAEWQAEGWPSYTERLARFGAAAVAKTSSTWRADVQRRVSAILADSTLTDASYVQTAVA